MQIEREGMVTGGAPRPGAYNPPDSSDGRIGTSEFGSDGARDGGMTDRAKDMGSEVADRAKEAGSQIESGADSGMDHAASGLENAASQVRDRMGGGEGMRAQAGTKVADGLEKASTYLREHESREVWDDVETYIRDHPTQALVGAVAAGFVIARVMR